MFIEPFFDEITSTLSYVVHDRRCAVVIDPVRDFDPKSGCTAWHSSQRIADYVDGEGLEIPYVIDTHVHADHLTGLPFFQERYGARSVTGAGVGRIQQTFAQLFHLVDLPTDGRQFDQLLDEGERLGFGSLEVEALHTPGHTPAHMSWKIGDAIFVGDTLFAPDYGTARCDFPGGSAADLYDSVQRLYAFPDETRLFLCHDYRPGGRPLVYQASVAEQKQNNVQLDARTSRPDFVAFREARDATLAMPNLILASIQVNIRAGALPEPEPNGVSYLKIPLDAMGAFEP